MRKLRYKRTFVYFLTTKPLPGEFDLTPNDIKIGIANDIGRRIKELQTGSSREIICLGSIKCKDREAAYRKEAALHKQFSHLRKHGEWFSPGMDLLLYIAAQFSIEWIATFIQNRITNDADYN